MIVLKASEARIPADVLGRVAYGGERACIQRRGGTSVFLVSEQAARLLDLIEDAYDLEEATRVLEELKAGKQSLLSAAEVERALGL